MRGGAADKSGELISPHQSACTDCVVTRRHKSAQAEALVCLEQGLIHEGDELKEVNGVSLEQRKPKEIPRLLVGWLDEPSVYPVQVDPSDLFHCQFIQAAVALGFQHFIKTEAFSAVLCSSLIVILRPLPPQIYSLVLRGQLAPVAY